MQPLLTRVHVAVRFVTLCVDSWRLSLLLLRGRHQEALRFPFAVALTQRPWPGLQNGADLEKLLKWVLRLNLHYRVTPRRCLLRSLVACRMLVRFGREPHLLIGISLDQSPSEKVALSPSGHCWLTDENGQALFDRESGSAAQYPLLLHQDLHVTYRLAQAAPERL